MSVKLLFKLPKLAFLLHKEQAGTSGNMGGNWIFSGRGHENKCAGRNGPIPSMTSRQNAMTSAFYFFLHLKLLSYCLTFPFLLSSYIFWGKEYKSICKSFYCCQLSYPKI